MVRCQIRVVPVYSVSCNSGFPISQSNVLIAAHALYEGCSIVAVAGAPFRASPASQKFLTGLPPEWDWALVRGATTELSPNILDGRVTLRYGDVVFIGGIKKKGFGWSNPESEGILHALRKPEVIAGRIVRPSVTNNGPIIVEVAVPYGDYHGYSGGPAAILDSNGHVRVWGVVVEQGWTTDCSKSGQRVFALRIARIPQQLVDKLQEIDHPLFPVQLLGM